MLNKNAIAWIEALRGPRFKQGKNVLAHVVEDAETEYCCLGVACELFNEANPTAPLTVTTLPHVYGSHEYADITVKQYGIDTKILPQPVRDWLGLRNASGTFGPQGNVSLAQLNDEGATFLAIAGIIESEPKGLFV